MDRRVQSRASRVARAALATMALAAGACGKGCWCSNAGKALLESPPDDVVVESTRERLKSDRKVASELCGVSVEGLEELTLSVTKKTLGTGSIHVSGKPVANADAGAAPLDPAKMLVCAGVIAFVATPILDGDGKASGWKLGELEVEGIETEGVHFDADAHRHHHHHG